MPSAPCGRRSVLATCGTGLVAVLAGCLGSGGGGGGDEPAAGNSGTETTSTTAAGGSPDETTASGSSGALDLREANVVGVAIERSGGEYTFDVTLHHDDDSELGYANWWQVETLGGKRLGRRELLHAHGSEPFTRSATIAVPQGVSRVIVRGHDEVHGYGGQAMIVTLPGGEAEVVNQGAEPRPLGNESGS